jgi:hypothetical protein
MKHSFTSETLLEETLDSALRRVKTRRELIDALGSETRALREYASNVLLIVAQQEPALLLDFGADIADALNRPESLTRYNTIETIGLLAQLQPKLVTSTFEALEDCLYDEDSGTVRLYAFRVLAAYGATGTARASKVWPSLSTALRCYHGDAEFIPMLNELIAMLGGKVDQNVKDSATRLFAFDADNAKGTLQRKAQTVTTFAPEVIEEIREEVRRKAAEAEARKLAEAEAAAELARAEAEAEAEAEAAAGSDDTGDDEEEGEEDVRS